MNKLVAVLGVAAVATLAGCKDPNYKPMSATSSKYDVKDVDPVSCTCPPGTVHDVACGCGAADCQCLVAPVALKCTCAPGTKHTSPCACGSADCKCVVEVKPLPPPPPPVDETTTYVVQNGDSLSKISAKYNVTINSIKRINNLKDDKIRIGQKLQLPGKFDVTQPVAKTPAKGAAAAATAKTTAAKKGSEPYTGATKEYVVKSGDMLGSVAYSNGCTIRQLKQLNGLKSDVLKVGQKLKVPADAKPTAKVDKNEPQSKVAPAGNAKPVETLETKPAPVPADADKAAATPVADPVVVAPPTPPAEPQVPDSLTYVVQDGDDITAVAIRYCVSAAAIRELNNLADDAQLTPGQIIKLPPDAQQ